jgi:hypothetical protein
MDRLRNRDPRTLSTRHKRSNEARFAPIEALRRFWLEGLRSFWFGMVTRSLLDLMQVAVGSLPTAQEAGQLRWATCARSNPYELGRQNKRIPFDTSTCRTCLGSEKSETS